jgi:hypothetical protein
LATDQAAKLRPVKPFNLTEKLLRAARGINYKEAQESQIRFAIPVPLL